MRERILRPKREKKAPWAHVGDSADAVSWDSVDPVLIVAVVATVCSAGASIQFTRTRDGGALGVRVYDDEIAAKTVWARPGGELDRVLETIRNYYAAEGG